MQPVLGIRSRSELGKLLKRYDDEGLGGVTMSDVKEALPKPEKAVKASVAGSMWMCVCACGLREALLCAEAEGGRVRHGGGPARQGAGHLLP